MNKFFKLLKIDLLNSFAFNTYKNTKKNKGKSKGPIVTLIISSIAMLFLMFVYSFSVSQMCIEANRLDVLIVYGVGLGGVLSFMMSLGKSYSILFQGKDYDFLNTLPIKTDCIIASKLASLIIVNFVYFNLGFVPSFIMYLMYSPFKITSIFVGLVIILLGPIFTCVVCSFLSTFIGYVLRKSRFKNALQVIASMLLLVLIFFSSYAISYNSASGSESSEYIIQFVNKIDDLFTKTYFMSAFARDAMNGSYLSLLYFVLVSIIPLIILIFVVSKLFVLLNEKSKETYKNKNFKLDKELNKTTKSRKYGVYQALLKKEYKTMFSNANIAMNVLVGPLVGLIASIVMVFSLTSAEMEADEVALTLKIASLISMTMLALCIGMAPSSAVSINLEGNKFWIIKSAPISEKLILFTKASAYVYLCIPTIIIASICNVIFCQMTIINMILMIITLIIITSTYSMIALWINCLVPKLKWNSVTEAVKQSAGTIFSMLISFVMDIILFGPTLVLSIAFDINPFIIALPMSIIVLGISILLLFTNGLNKFKKIDAE